jgi:hypothetical protein
MTKTDFAVLNGTIDESNAVIEGVSVITIGEAKGHGMLVDDQTLVEVKAAAETYSGGLKVKTDHFSGFNQIVGVLRNFVIDGDQLRADLFLLKNHDATPRIIEMAQMMPDTFGLSISFSGQHEESEDGTVFARCSEIYSADLVDAPAANDAGLFSAKVDSEKKAMDEKQFAEALSAALAPINEKLSAFEAFMSEATTKFAALEYKPEDEEKDMEEAPEIPKEDEEEDNMSAKLAAELAEIKSLVTNFGAKPVAPAVAVEVKAEAAAPTNFSEALAVVKAEGLSGSAATKAVIARYPDLYLAARNSGIKTL